MRTLAGTEDTKYAYTNGVVRSKEARLLTKDHFERLVRSDFADLGAVLTETEYGGAPSLGAAIAETEAAERNFFNRHCLDADVRRSVAWAEQVHNLKVRLKGGGDSLRYESVSTEVESWPEIAAAADRYATDRDPFVFSTSLDRILCRHLPRLFEPFAFLRAFLTLSYDLENIRNFFRARQFAASADILTHVYVEPSAIDKNMLVENLAAATADLGRVFARSGYASIVEPGGRYLETNRSFLRLERMIEERKLEYLRRCRVMVFGVEPLYGYYYFKRTELKKLRQVLAAKQSAVAEEELRESIADVW